MLQHLNNVFFKVATIDRKQNHDVPTVYLDLYDRRERKLIGQIRFNHDPLYSKNSKDIRMSFDVFEIKDLDPTYTTYLEDIIVGGFLWITMDNHYTYPFHPRPYMVVHNYKEDPELMKLINQKEISILQNLKCKHGEADENMYIFSREYTSPYLSQKLSNHN